MFKTMRQAEKMSQVGSNSSLCNNTKKWKFKKKLKIKRQTHAFKGYANSSHVEVLNSFNPELQLKKNWICI